MANHSLMSPPLGELRNRRKVRRTDLVPIPHKWFEVVALHLAGKPTKEICEITGYSLGTYYRVMNNPRTIAVRQQLLEHYQDEFEALFCSVIDNIRDQLGDDNMKVRQTAQQQWLNAEGKFKVLKNRVKDKETAEDLVSKMLNVNVQVNVQNQGENAVE